MHNPGKYDHLCTRVRIEARATAAIVIVIGGEHGDGFSVQAINQQILDAIPNLLDHIARDIREQKKDRPTERAAKGPRDRRSSEPP